MYLDAEQYEMSQQKKPGRRWLPLLLLVLWVVLWPKLPNANSQGHHEVDMKWDSMGAEEYGVYRGTSPNSLELVAVVNTPSYKDVSFLQDGATYYYAVTSRTDSDGYESVKSDVVSAKIPKTGSNGAGGC
jgi:hypothetical protein